METGNKKTTGIQRRDGMATGDAIRVSWKTDDGLFEWMDQHGDIELIDEAEFKARGGKVVGWTMPNENIKVVKGGANGYQ